MGSSGEIFRPAFAQEKDIEGNSLYQYVSCGLTYDASCAKHVQGTCHSKRAYIIASSSLSKQTSHVRDLEKALGSNHIATWVGIRPHTPWEDLVPIINDMREKQADCLITIGGGSLIDGAKIIIFALANDVHTISDLEALTEKRPRDDAGINSKFRDHSDRKSPNVPLICIPTTLSAGEYSRFGGGTSSKTHLKVIMTHPKMYPSLVILDPALCTTTPEWVWLSTGVRAIDHCVEAMCSLQSIPAVDVEAERALKLLIPNLLKTKADPEDLEARLQCQLATNHVLVMLLYSPKILLACASHGIGHQLGPLGVGHGETSCILLPAVLSYNARANSEKQEKVKNIIWSDETVVEVLKKAGLEKDKSNAGDALDAVFRALGMPRTLKDVGVGRDMLDILAENSLKDPCCEVNPIPLTEKAQVMEILEMVVGD